MPTPRVVVWSTGGIGTIAARVVHRRPDMELVGVWVHAPAKVGRDVGELVGLGSIGLRATDDAEQLRALRPDCVVYAASGPDRDRAAVPDYVRLLRSGINVVTTTSTQLVFPPVYEPTWREQLSEATRLGHASIYASGIFPGFASDYLPVVLATQSNTIRTVRVSEISLNDHYPVAAAMMNGLGFGRPVEFEPQISKPGYIETIWRAPLHLIAAGLGVELEAVRGRFDRVVTERDITVAFGTIEAGTCGAVRTTAMGLVHGREAIIVEHVIRMARDVAPDWPTAQHDATYCVTIEGDPDIDIRMTVGAPEGHTAGQSAMTATAMRAVNAIPYVVAAAPGVLSSLDLPLTRPANVFL